MKRISLIFLVLTVLAVPVWAQMGGYMHERGETEEGSPGYGPGYGYGMGPGMMGPGYGYGMGPGMMGPGYGYGMGPGMMGPGYGYGMGPGMMGPGYGNYGFWNSKEGQKLLDETADLRKQLHMKMFEYMEMVRSGAPEDKLEAAAKEIYKLRMQLFNKMPGKSPEKK